jgi:hypothetical protein
MNTLNRFKTWVTSFFSRDSGYTTREDWSLAFMEMRPDATLLHEDMPESCLNISIPISEQGVYCTAVNFRTDSPQRIVRQLVKTGIREHIPALVTRYDA